MMETHDAYYWRAGGVHRGSEVAGSMIELSIHADIAQSPGAFSN